jgi:hypothetical protein
MSQSKKIKIYDEDKNKDTRKNPNEIPHDIVLKIFEKFKDDPNNKEKIADYMSIRQTSKYFNEIFDEFGTLMKEYNQKKIDNKKKRHYKNMFFPYNKQKNMFENIWQMHYHLRYEDEYENVNDFNDFIINVMTQKNTNNNWHTFIDIVDGAGYCKSNEGVGDELLYQKNVKSIIKYKFKQSENKICWVRFFMEEFEESDDDVLEGFFSDYYMMTDNASNNWKKFNPEKTDTNIFHKIEFGCERIGDRMDGLYFEHLIKLQNVDYDNLSKELNKSVEERKLRLFWSIIYNIKIVGDEIYVYYIASHIDKTTLYRSTLRKFIAIMIINKDVLNCIKYTDTDKIQNTITKMHKDRYLSTREYKNFDIFKNSYDKFSVEIYNKKKLIYVPLYAYYSVASATKINDNEKYEKMLTTNINDKNILIHNDPQSMDRDDLKKIFGKDVSIINENIVQPPKLRRQRATNNIITSLQNASFQYKFEDSFSSMENYD